MKFFPNPKYLTGLILSLNLWVTATSKPVVTGPEVRAFLGGRTGKIVYIKDNTYRIYYLDLNDSVLVEHKVAENSAANPMISWDGTRVLYERGNNVYIRDLVENSSTEYTVYTGGLGAEPHWWVQPGTSNEYVTYTWGDLNDTRWPPPSGTTSIVRVINNVPQGTPTMLLPFMMTTGRSRDGKWGGSAQHSVGMYQFDPTRVDSAFRSSTNWMDSGSLLACNASISMSSDPTRENRMMHLTSGQGNMWGTAYDNHKAVVIRGWNDPDINHPFWYMGLPGDHCNNDSSGNQFWGYPEWSTDEEYFTATGSKDVDIATTGDLYVIRIDTNGNNRILRVLQGDGTNITPHLWVKNGVLPAKIRLDHSALSFTALQKDTVNPDSQVVQVSNAGDGTLPALTVQIPAADSGWLKVAVRNNGTNTPALITRVTRTGLTPGNYSAKVTVTYGGGIDSAGYAVSFVFSDPILARLVPKPHTAYLVPGDTAQLLAYARDQMGQPYTGFFHATWSGSPGVHLTSDGKVTVDSTQLFQTLSVTITTGAIACTTTVMAVRAAWRYATDTALRIQGWQGWLSDSAILGSFVGDQNPDTTMALDSLMDPAPAAAYRFYRKSPTGFTLPVPNGRYRVRLHFCSQRDSTLGPNPVTVSLEGQKVGAVVMVPAKPHQAVAAALFEGDASVADSNGLRVDLASTGLGFGLSAIEVYAIAPTPVQVRAPNGGENYSIGDSLIVRWDADTSWVRSVGVQLSVDSGLTWIPLTRTRSVALHDPDWGRFAFLLSNVLDGKSLVSKKAMVSVYEYFGGDRDRSDRVFSIGNGAVTGLQGPALAARVISMQPQGQGRFRITGLEGPADLSVVSIQGRLGQHFSLSADPAGTSVDLSGLPTGLLAATLRLPNGRQWRQLIVHAH